MRLHFWLNISRRTKQGKEVKEKSVPSFIMTYFMTFVNEFVNFQVASIRITRYFTSFHFVSLVLVLLALSSGISNVASDKY